MTTYFTHLYQPYMLAIAALLNGTDPVADSDIEWAYEVVDRIRKYVEKKKPS